MHCFGVCKVDNQLMSQVKMYLILEKKIWISIHLSSTPYPVKGRRGGWTLPQLFGQRWGSPWTSCHFITGLTYRDKQPSTPTFTPRGNLEWPINLLTCSLHVFGLWEEARLPGGKKHTDTGKTCKLHTDFENSFCWLHFNTTTVYKCKAFWLFSGIIILEVQDGVLSERKTRSHVTINVLV